MSKTLLVLALLACAASLMACEASVPAAIAEEAGLTVTSEPDASAAAAPPDTTEVDVDAGVQIDAKAEDARSIDARPSDAKVADVAEAEDGATVR